MDAGSEKYGGRDIQNVNESKSACGDDAYVHRSNVEYGNRSSPNCQLPTSSPSKTICLVNSFPYIVLTSFTYFGSFQYRSE